MKLGFFLSRWWRISNTSSMTKGRGRTRTTAPSTACGCCESGAVGAHGARGLLLSAVRCLPRGLRGLRGARVPRAFAALVAWPRGPSDGPAHAADASPPRLPGSVPMWGLRCQKRLMLWGEVGCRISGAVALSGGGQGAVRLRPRSRHSGWCPGQRP